jgi:hypothetical protein
MIPHVFKISLKDDPFNPSRSEETPEAYYFVQENSTDEHGGFVTSTAVKADSELPADVKAKLDACFQDPVVATYLASLTPNT